MLYSLSYGIWGIFSDCQMVRDLHLNHVIYETNLSRAAKMTQNRFTSTFHLQTLFHEILSLVNLLGWTIQRNYVHYEANSCVDDALALRGHDV